MQYFGVTGVLEGQSFALPMHGVSFVYVPGEGLNLLHYAIAESTLLSLNPGQLATYGENSGFDARVALGSGSSPNSLLAGIHDAVLAIAGENTARGLTTFLAPGAQAVDSAVVLGAEVNDGQFIYVAESDASGFSVYKLGSGGTLDLVAALADGAYCDGIAAMARISTDQGQFLYTGSALDHGIDIYEIGADGLPVLNGSVGVEELLPVQTITALAPVSIDAVQYLLVAAAGSSSLSVLVVNDDGGLDVTDHVIDTQDTRFGGISHVQVFEQDGHSFIVAAGTDGGISLLALLPGGQLIHLETLADGTDTGLIGISGLELVQIGSEIQLFVASATEAGLTQLSLDMSNLGNISTASSGTLIGTDGQDMLALDGSGTLQGGGNNDILRDGNGVNTLSGGAGEDIFVLTADGETDVIADFEVGLDRIDLTLIPQLYSINQIDITYTTNGAILRFGDEVLEVYTAGGVTLVPSVFEATLLSGLNRVSVALGTSLPSVQIGGAGDDSLTGLPSSDTISGLAGDDMITGLGGADSLVGGPGADTLLGSAGNDTLSGGGGADRLYGGTGNDRLLGGNGSDSISGGFDNDLLDGGFANDVLRGNGGADTLLGGDGRDTLIGGNGNDRLDGGNDADRLDGGVRSDTLLGRDGDDLLLGRGGADHLYGGDGDDSGEGGNGNDRFFGGDGNDTFSGGGGNDRGHGNAGNDSLRGGGGNDTLVGNSGNDTLNGGLNDDELIGGGNSDVFVFADGHGNDTINDFNATNAAEDIDLTAVTSIGDFTQLQAVATQVGSDVLIDTGNGNSITLLDVSLSDLDAGDFLF